MFTVQQMPLYTSGILKKHKIIAVWHETHLSQNKKVSRFWSPRASPQTHPWALLIFFFAMKRCSQNCWINWNSTMLCFKRLFHIGVSTFARFVRPLLATTLCIWEIWSPRTQGVTYFHVGKKRRCPEKTKKKIITSVTAPILKPNDDQKPDFFFGGGGGP